MRALSPWLMSMCVACGAAGQSDGDPRCGDGVQSPGELCYRSEPFAVDATLEIDVGDVDGDGHVDIAGLEAATPSLYLRRGDGRGGLAEPELQPLGAAGELAMCDLNGDGGDEILVLSGFADRAELIVHRAGDGIREIQRTTHPPDGQRLRCHDLDGDGRQDLIMGSGTEGIEVHIRRGMPDATLSAAEVIVPPMHLRVIALADMNGDGKDDLLGALDRGADAVLTMLRVGADYEPLDAAAAGGCVRDLAVGFLDGDERLDVITADAGTDSVTLLSGNGDGTFASSKSLPLYGGRLGCHFGPEELELSDIDADGDHDVAVVHRLGHAVIMLAQTDEGLREAARYAVPAFPVSLAAADLNEDGVVDFVVSSPERDSAEPGFWNIEAGLGRVTLLLSQP